MPGWHDATEDLRETDAFQTVGIIQEQHPDRARLFMQWREMEWPILVDSYNLLEVPYVPITLAIDEHGIVREIQPPRDDIPRFERNFLSATFAAGAEASPTGTQRPDVASLKTPSRNARSADWTTYGNTLAVWGGPSRVDEVINAYERVARAEAEDGWAHFRLGVAHRMRYDGADRHSGDFQDAVEHWSTALAIDPNQYIWRRRIQQYGPRLDKPYPFYDWVITAREELTARGKTPSPLVVEPRGAEFTSPSRTFATSTSEEDEPDPRGRVLRDEGQFIDVEVIAVPATIAPGDAARFHVVFRPVVANKSHWNNEAEDLAFWIDPPRGWEAERQYLALAIPPEAVSQETRTLEVELRAPERHRPRTVTIPAYALYYVCEDVNGICMYRRQDVELEIAVRRP